MVAGWRRHAGWLGGLLVAWTAACLLLLGLATAHAAPAEPGNRRHPAAVLPPHAAQVTLQLCEAIFSTRLAGPWEAVHLPDTWSKRGVEGGVRGHYRLQFDLPHVPEQMWALSLSKLSQRHEIRLNGALVSGDIERANPLWTSRPVPHMVVLSPSLLRPGRNTLDIAVQHPSQGGLTCVSLGRAVNIQAAHSSVDRYATTVPLLLNAAALGFAVFIGLVWLRHRDPLMPGTVPLLWALASSRHIARLTTEGWLTGSVADWAYYTNSVLASFVAAHLGLTLARLDSRHTLRQMYAVAALFIAGGALATYSQQLPGLRSLTTPLMIVQLMAALVAAGRAVFRQPDSTRRALFYSLALVSSAWVFDYTSWFGLLRFSTPLAMPYMVPLSMGLLAWALLQRLVLSLAQVRSAKAQLELRVEQRTLALRQANAAKSRFLAAASHDLRQPVVTIGLLIDLLREQTQEPAQREMIHRVDEAVASMEGFLGGLLDLSRFEAGTVTPRRQRVALQSLFDAVATHAVESARLKGLRLRFRPTRLAVHTDPLLLEQILRNLVSNALRYTHHGGVLVVARAQAGQVLLQVWDTGIGIPPEHQSSVFEELVQLDNPGRESIRGFGLGLAIVQRAADLLGHRLALRSQPARGSCFGVQLPRAPTLTSVPPSAPALHRPLAGLRLVVVDDDPSVLAALGERLSYWGAEVQRHNSLGAVRRTWPARDPLLTPVQRGSRTPLPSVHQPIDLLITDQRLPDGSGLDVVAWVRQTQPGVPVLVITGNTEPDELARLQGSGVPVLHKPFRAEALLLAIQQGLRPRPSR